ncbi:hypothetical protein [Actinomadura rudentiformis]|uniref:Uncharacterized protein n=1 Tax=Actinomadura rudentiformis TaxID=359158 RepID=A0A6H9YL53_9ACTN|nr:hypothetical protein [Actinomadura rudentiformis]KAB2343732.1 hypothetical protein F8566_33985 [Actinomadura rudentiformis]
MTRIAIAGMAGHVFFELAAGVGMPLASLVGARGAAVGWAVGTRTAWRAAGRRGYAETAFAALNTMSLAAVIAHLAGWPRRYTRARLPWLRDCEGLGPEMMPFYNPILYVSGAAALGALLTENRRAPHGLPLLTVPLVPVLIAAQHCEHRRLTRIAAERPGWWNRRLRRG